MRRWWGWDWEWWWWWGWEWEWWWWWWWWWWDRKEDKRWGQMGWWKVVGKVGKRKRRKEVGAGHQREAVVKEW